MVAKNLEQENEKLERILVESEDVLEICKVYSQFWDNYMGKFIEWDKDEDKSLIINYDKCNMEFIQQVLESEAAVTYCKYALTTRWDFPKVYRVLYGNPCSEKNRENAKKVIEAMKQLILEDNKNYEVHNPTLAKLYDELICCYYTAARANGVEIDDATWASIGKFYNNMAEDLHFFDTKFYNDFWLNEKDSDEKVYNVFPIKSKEEYEAKLAEFTFDRNGMVSDHIKYDQTLGEYLLFYGDEIPYEEKEKYLHIMSKNAYKGKFYATQTAKYFTNTVTGNEILENNPLLVMNDIIRNYKISYYTVVCLNSPIYRKIYKQMKESYKDYITELGKYGKDAAELARYLLEANGVHTFTRRYQPDSAFKNINDIIDVEEFIRRTHVNHSLAENFDYEKLDDDTIHEDGLTNFDYADIALSIVTKKNTSAGINDIFNEKLRGLYERYGRNIYDSRATRQIVKNFVDSASKYKFSSQYMKDDMKETCIDFIRHVSGKPGFNLFSDQECSDIIQIAKRKDDDVAKSFVEEIAKGMMENSEYHNMSLEDANQYVLNFINNVGDRPIGKESEQEFEEFLRAISIIKINDEKGAVPQEVNEFIIRQSLTENSILNSNDARYESIFERAVENLYLNRGEYQEGDKALLYFVCDVDEYKDYFKGAYDMIRIDRKRLIHTLLEDPTFSKVNEKDNVPPYVAQYVDLDAIEANILGKAEAIKYENTDLIEEKEDVDSREER